MPGGGPGQPNPNGGNLSGTSWSGNETLPGYDRLSFRFNQGGQAVMMDNDGNSQGSWNQTGTNVTLTFGDVVYSGTIQGNRIQGTARNGRGQQWNWSVGR